MENKCIRCGECCKNLILSISPDRLKLVAERPELGMSNDDLLYSIWKLVESGKANDKYEFDWWRYECKELTIDKNGLATCGIQEIKPTTCASYPWDAKLFDKNGNLKGEDRFPNCGFNK